MAYKHIVYNDVTESFSNMAMKASVYYVRELWRDAIILYELDMYLFSFRMKIDYLNSFYSKK